MAGKTTRTGCGGGAAARAQPFDVLGNGRQVGIRRSYKEFVYVISDSF